MQKNGTRMVIGIGLSQPLLEAARELGIKSVEVQHGLLNEGTLDKHFGDRIPDVFLAWNQKSAEIAEARGMSSLIVGNPVSFGEAISVAKEKQKLPLCVALQYERILGLVLPMQHPSLSAVLEQAASQGKKIIFRLHPVVESKTMARAISVVWLRLRWPGNAVHFPSKFTIEDSANLTQGLVTWKSGTAYEFTLLGKKALFTDESARQNLIQHLRGEQISQGLIARNLDDLYSPIQHFGRRHSPTHNRGEIVKLLKKTAQV